MGSLRLQVRVLDNGSPFFALGAQEGGELFRRIGDEVLANLCQILLGFR